MNRSTYTIMMLQEKYIEGIAYVYEDIGKELRWNAKPRPEQSHYYYTQYTPPFFMRMLN